MRYTIMINSAVYLIDEFTYNKLLLAKKSNNILLYKSICAKIVDSHNKYLKIDLVVNSDIVSPW